MVILGIAAAKQASGDPAIAALLAIVTWASWQRASFCSWSRTVPKNRSSVADHAGRGRRARPRTVPAVKDAPWSMIRRAHLLAGQSRPSPGRPCACGRQRRHSLLTILEAGRSVVIDLSEAAFVDSAIIRIVVNAREAASHTGRVVVVVSAAGSEPRKLIELVRLSDVVPTFDARDAAVAYASPSRGGRSGV
jgi:anti-anti-sigma regulatory factor